MRSNTLVFIFGITAILGSSGEKFFRRDYNYYEKYNAFYKLHWADSSSTWQMAFITCDNEGAKLFYPEAPEEWTIAANLSETLTGIEEIFVGIRDEFNQGQFVSIEGNFIDELTNNDKHRDEAESKCIVMSVTTGSYSAVPCEHKRPFICKKIDNESCPTVDSAYMYSKVTNKCYKINKRPTTWQDAVATCYMEGAILSTLAENFESTFLPNLMGRQDFFIGIRRILPLGSFYSLQGSKFEQPEQPDESNGQLDCKVIRFRQSNYNNEGCDGTFIISSEYCHALLPFVCEMEVKV